MQCIELLHSLLECYMYFEHGGKKLTMSVSILVFKYLGKDF